MVKPTCNDHQYIYAEIVYGKPTHLWFAIPECWLGHRLWSHVRPSPRFLMFSTVPPDDKTYAMSTTKRTVLLTIQLYLALSVRSRHHQQTTTTTTDFPIARCSPSQQSTKATRMEEPIHHLSSPRGILTAMISRKV